MQSPPPAASDAPIRDEHQLEDIFRAAEKPAEQFRVGAEAEKFGLLQDSDRPVQYAGERSIIAIFERLTARHGWKGVSEAPGSPLIALERGQASITLEPGAQLELSGAPWPDVHGVHAEFSDHFRELGGISKELGLEWLSLGFQPFAKFEDLSWVPKERYGIMKEYLPRRGRRGRDMMQRTATVQANFDYSDEEDALRKLRTMLGLAPVFSAMCANAPFLEGRVSELKSERLDVWLNMDAARSGLIPNLWQSERPSYRDYVQWALDAGMFFVKRGSRLVLNTGQTFREFMQHGFERERATHADWFRHLATLFPDARLKSTLEVRMCDALPSDLTMAVPALFTGLLYDARALGAAEQLARSISLEAAMGARAEVPRIGLAGELAGRPVRALAEELVEIARGGLARRRRLDAAGQDESVYLEPLARLVGAGRCPADELRDNQVPGAALDRKALVRARVAGEHH